MVARRLLNSDLPVPNLYGAWEAATNSLREMLESDAFISEYTVDEWAKLARIIETYEPEFFYDNIRLQDYRDDREQLSRSMQEELDSMESPCGKKEFSEVAERMRSLAGSLSELEYDEVIANESITDTISRLERRAETYEEEIKDDDDADDEEDKTTEDKLTGEPFDIQALFADL